jgi:hypothetical protein
MRNKHALAGIAVMLAWMLGSACPAQAQKKSLAPYKTVVVQPFQTSISSSDASGLPEATRTAVIQALKDAGFFAEILTPDEASTKLNPDKTSWLQLEARLVDFAPGNAAKRIMLGFGSGRAHARFEFTFKDAASGEVLWQDSVKQTAKYWGNAVSSSSGERSELPQGVAKKLMEQLNKARAK